MSKGRAARVHALLDAARALARDARHPSQLVADLVSSTGLSPEGVRLGLTRHLETEATPAEIEALLAAAGEATEVTVVLSANAFVAPLRALALACAAAPRVRVRASRREPVFVRALVGALAEGGSPLGIELVSSVDFGALREGEVHVYGRQQTLDAIRPQLARGVRFRGHGPGLGVAIVCDGDDLAGAASALTEDVVAFDQRGCLSPRIAFVQGTVARVEAFGRALHASLEGAGLAIPRGALDASEREERARYASTASFTGELFEGPSHLVGVQPASAALLLPPPGRHLHLVAWSAPSDLARPLGLLARQVVAVGVDDPEPLREILPAHARLSRVGFMQRPRLDGPVDRRARGL